VRDAVKRGALTLLAVALLSPATLPWYFTWALALAAGFAWSTGALVTVTTASLFLLLVTFPNGDTALYSWVYLLFALVVSGLAARSLVKPDPFGLSSRYE
jgi:alpha-1,6-mannosyltransferase